MKKIICLLSLVLLIGCTVKKDIAVVNNSPNPTLTSTPTPTPTPLPSDTSVPPPPIIDTNIYNIYLEPGYILPETPETLDDVDFNEFSSGSAVVGLHFICPQGVYYGHYDNLNDPYVSMTLSLKKWDNQNHISFVLAETPVVFFGGVFNRIAQDFYSYYGYKFTSEEIEEIIYDESYVKYFKYEDGYIYIYPDGLSMDEMQAYQFDKEPGCKLYSIVYPRNHLK